MVVTPPLLPPPGTPEDLSSDRLHNGSHGNGSTPGSPTLRLRLGARSTFHNVSVTAHSAPRRVGPTARVGELLLAPTLPHRPAVLSSFFPFHPLITEIIVATIFAGPPAAHANAVATASQR